MDRHVTHFREDLVLKLVNEVSFLAFFATNILCLASGKYGHGHPTWLDPATMTYAVWTVIQVLFIGTMAYQWTDRGKAIVIDALHWRLAAVFALATVHLHLWYHSQWLASFIFIVALSAAVTNTYYIVKRWYPATNVYDEILVHTPISMLHAWTSFLVLEIAFETFSENHGFPPKTWIIVYFTIAVILLLMLSGIYALASPEGDFAAGITLMWALYGVTRRLQPGAVLHEITYWAIVLSIPFVAKSAWGFYKYKFATLKDGFVYGRDADRAPFLGGELGEE